MIAIARWAIRRPRRAIALWLVIVAALGVLGTGVQDDLSTASVVVPGTNSDRAEQSAERSFGRRADVPVLLQGPAADVAAQQQRLATALRTPTRTVAVLPGSALRGGGRNGLVVASVEAKQSLDGSAGDEVRRVTASVVQSPVRASVSGFSVIGGAISHESVEGARQAELIAIPILLIVLLLVFRSPVAAAIPAVLGIATVVSSYGLVDLIARSTDIADVATPLASMLGLALGVDYALLLVSRFREARTAGLDVEAAAAVAVESAGRTVLFAGATLLVTMVAAMLLSPGTFLLSAAVGVSSSGLMALLGSLLAVPALLVLLGPNLDRWRIGATTDDSSRWERFANAVQRRPVAVVLVALVPLVALTVPAVGLDTGPPDVRVLPASSSARIDTERVAGALGPGWVAPFRLVAHGPQAPAAVARLRATLTRDPDIAAVLGPTTGRDGATRLDLIPKSAPAQDATGKLNDRLRDLAAEPRYADARVDIGGVAAQLTDYRRVLSQRLIVLIAVLSVVAFLALVVILRAIVLPLISVALNLLTVGASLGLVALFCTGPNPLLGGAGFADILALLGMFAIVFALSLDYQVFILARIRETWLATGRIDHAITRSIASTGRVITGAAAIMFGVFLAFTVSDLQTIRQPGIGLAAAVAIDATLVRLALLPATLRLAGAAAFWLPTWLDRVLPRLDLEGPETPAAAGPPPDGLPGPPAGADA